MPRLKTISPEQAEGKTQELFQAAQKALGRVPNIFQGLGNSPAALKAYMSMDEALAGGNLTEAQRHVVYLAVSEKNTCEYCLAAHTELGRKAGLSEEDMLAVRRRKPQNPKHKALVDLTLAIMDRRGSVSDEALDAFRKAGFDDGHIAEVVGMIAESTFSNYFNHVYQTELDFPKAPSV